MTSDHVTSVVRQVGIYDAEFGGGYDVAVGSVCRQTDRVRGMDLTHYDTDAPAFTVQTNKVSA